jgi:hypothetical protein
MEYSKSNRDKKVDSRAFEHIMSGKGTIRLHQELLWKAHAKKVEQGKVLARRAKSSPL